MVEVTAIDNEGARTTANTGLLSVGNAAPEISVAETLEIQEDSPGQLIDLLALDANDLLDSLTWQIISPAVARLGRH